MKMFSSSDVGKDSTKEKDEQKETREDLKDQILGLRIALGWFYY